MISKQCHHLNLRHKILIKSGGAIVFPCRMGDILQEGEPLSTTAHQARSDLGRESQHNSLEYREET